MMTTLGATIKSFEESDQSRLVAFIQLSGLITLYQREIIHIRVFLKFVKKNIESNYCKKFTEHAR